MTITELRPESWAEQSAKAAKTEAEAEALRAKTAADVAARELAQQLKASKAAAEIAEGEEKAAEVRQAAEARRREQLEQLDAARRQKAKAARSADQWRKAALTIAAICVVVSLPLQVLAFYSPRAPFLAAAPLVLEGTAWALLKGAEAAIDDNRPSWHYRLGALVVALFAASVNWIHGSAAFGIATGLGGAFCSLVGPMIWDLHEHGRINKRDGKVSRRERRATAKAAAKQARVEAEQAAEAANQRAAVDARREALHPQVWERAVALSAALGETAVSDKTWGRAWAGVHGADLGDTADSIAAAVAAKAAAKEAAGAASVATKSQVVPQVPATQDKAAKGPGRGNPAGPPVRGRRTSGDTSYSSAARRQMAVAASSSGRIRKSVNQQKRAV